MVPPGTADKFIWMPTVASTATHQVYAKWPANQPLAKDAVHNFTDSTGTSTNVTVDVALDANGNIASIVRLSQSNIDLYPDNQLGTSYRPKERILVREGMPDRLLLMIPHDFLVP